MEKRNFVTSVRTPMEGASDIDDILEAGAASFGCGREKTGSSFEKKASDEDEMTDKADGAM